MPNIKSAKKRVAVIEKKNSQNKMIKSSVKTAIKKYNAALAAGDAAAAEQLLPQTVSVIDARSKRRPRRNNGKRTLYALSFAARNGRRQFACAFLTCPPFPRAILPRTFCGNAAGGAPFAHIFPRAAAPPRTFCGNAAPSPFAHIFPLWRKAPLSFCRAFAKAPPASAAEAGRGERAANNSGKIFAKRLPFCRKAGIIKT